jgi:hypothetical protein
MDLFTCSHSSFNLLQTFHNPAQKIYHVDLRGLLGNIDPQHYKAGWTNELHPTHKGFELIANVFAEQIDKALHADGSEAASMI